jgi:hypothetical protein
MDAEQRCLGSAVIAGLDPAIHPFAKMMDPRVKPAGDSRDASTSSEHAVEHDQETYLRSYSKL